MRAELLRKLDRPLRRCEAESERSGPPSAAPRCAPHSPYSVPRSPSAHHDHLQSIHVQSVRGVELSAEAEQESREQMRRSEPATTHSLTPTLLVSAGVLGSDGVCLLSRRYHQAAKSKKFLLGQQKLMWGLLYSLKDFVNQLAPKTSERTTRRAQQGPRQRTGQQHSIESISSHSLCSAAAMLARCAAAALQSRRDRARALLLFSNHRIQSALPPNSKWTAHCAHH